VFVNRADCFEPFQRSVECKWHSLEGIRYEFECPRWDTHHSCYSLCTANVPPCFVSAREQGYVVVQALVDEGGHAKRVEVLRSSGFLGLDHSTVVAVRQWTFAPTDGSGGPEARTTTQRSSVSNDSSP
jgi:TonB family protein